MTPTAESFFKGIKKHEDYLNIAKAFAKMHVIEALKEASIKAEIENDFDNKKFNISIDSILYAYPLENIK
jgi:hypothetical protein